MHEKILAKRVNAKIRTDYTKCFGSGSGYQFFQDPRYLQVLHDRLGSSAQKQTGQVWPVLRSGQSSDLTAVGNGFPSPLKVENLVPGAGQQLGCRLWGIFRILKLHLPAGKWRNDREKTPIISDSSSARVGSSGPISRRYGSANEVLELASAQADFAEKLGIWHPDKGWFALKAEQTWFLVTICLRLWSLSSLKYIDSRLAGWLERLPT